LGLSGFEFDAFLGYGSAPELNRFHAKFVGPHGGRLGCRTIKARGPYMTSMLGLNAGTPGRT